MYAPLEGAVIALSSLLLRDKAGSGGNLGLFLIVTSHPELYEVTCARKSQRIELAALLATAAKAAPKLAAPSPSSDAGPREEDEEAALDAVFAHLTQKAEWEGGEEGEAYLRTFVRGRYDWFAKLATLLAPLASAGPSNRRLMARVCQPSRTFPPLRLWG